jgi:hypothetical protein
MRHHQAVATLVPARHPGSAPGHWRHTAGLCCYVAAGILLAGAVILPIVALVFFVGWLWILIDAAVHTAKGSIGPGGAGLLGQVIEMPGHDPLGGMAVMMAVIGSALVSGLVLTAVVLLSIEALLLIGALLFFLIGRRLRRGLRIHGNRPPVAAAARLR